MQVFIRSNFEKEKVELGALESTLQNKYLDRHVSVEFKLPSGITRVDYLTVEPSGGLVNSFTGEKYSAALIKKEVSK